MTPFHVALSFVLSFYHQKFDLVLLLVLALMMLLGPQNAPFRCTERKTSAELQEPISIKIGECFIIYMQYILVRSTLYKR